MGFQFWEIWDMPNTGKDEYSQNLGAYELVLINNNHLSHFVSIKDIT